MRWLWMVLAIVCTLIIGSTNIAASDDELPGPIIQIDLANQVLMYTNERHQLVRSFHCSTGREGYRTPRGEFEVYAKEKHAISYKYGNAPMPFTLWFQSAGYGIHASSHVPNYPASHGCVRLKYEDAEWLFNQTPVGTTVIIY